MDPDAFRAAAHELVDWIADRRAEVASRPVRPDVDPGDIRRAMPASPPESGGPWSELLDDFDRLVAPGIVEVQHPMHFGWFPSNAALASILGDIASSGLGSLGISWESSPALTEVEEVVCDWMRGLVGLGEAWSGVIQDTASSAALVAMICARERATDHIQTRGGIGESDGPLTVYTTSEAHSSVRKAALLAGIGAAHLRSVPIDPWTRDMDPEALRTMMDEDRAAGRTPAAVVASVGSTAVTAFDPVDAIVEAASAHQAWVHVDAAMAGTAMLLAEMRPLWQGVEGADSVSWNPHKWMGTILDCSLFYVRDPEHLVRVMSTNPSYLRSDVDGEVTQFRDWGIPLGRRFRALKLWFHLRLDGVDAIRDRVRRDLDNAAWLAAAFEAEPEWEVVAPVRLQTVCVVHRPNGLDGAELDRHTLDWAGRINRSGAAYITPSQLDGRWMVRISVGVEATERHHLERLVGLMREAAAQR